jgi:hypothetical protein
LPPELADPARRREKLQAALEKLRAADAVRKRDGVDPQKSLAQLPPADLDARLLPNKEGGYAPNYTPTAAVGGASGMIVDCDVIDVPKENGVFFESMDRIEENFARSPERAMADTAMGTIVNLEGMESRNIDFYTPVESPLRNRAIPPCVKTLPFPWRRRIGRSFPAMRGKSWPNRASSTTKRRTTIPVRWVKSCITTNRANAGAKGAKSPSAAIAAGSAPTARWRPPAWTPNASMAERSAATARSRCGRRWRRR